MQEKVHLKSTVSEEKLSRKEKKAMKKRGFTPDYVSAAQADEPRNVFSDVPNNASFAFDDNPENVFNDDFIPLDIVANEKLATKHSSMTIKAAELAAEAEKPKRRVFSEDEVTAARRRAEFELRKNQIKKQREAAEAKEAHSFVAPEVTVQAQSSETSPAHDEPPAIIIDVPFAEEAFEPQSSYNESTRNENLENKYKRSAEYASVINEFPNAEEKKRIAREQAEMLEKQKQQEEELARERAAAEERARELEEKRMRELELERAKARQIELERAQAREHEIAEERIAKEKELFEAKLAEERALAEKRIREEAAEHAGRAAVESIVNADDDPIARIFEEEMRKTAASSPNGGIALEFTTEDSSDTQVFNFDDGNTVPIAPDQPKAAEESTADLPHASSVSDNSLPDMFTEEKSQPNVTSIPKDDFIFESEEAQTGTNEFVFESTQNSENSSNDFIFDGGDDTSDENDDFVFEPESDDETDDDVFPDIIPESEQNPQINEYRKMFSMFDEEKSSSNASIPDITKDVPALSDYSDYESSTYSNDIFSTVSSTENMIDESEFESEDTNQSEDELLDNDDFPPFDFEPSQIEIEEPAVQKQEKPDYSNYVFPSLDLLAKGVDEEDPTIEEEISETGDKLIDTLAQFNVRASIKSVDRGPRITRYEIVPARGVRVSSVMSTENDIKLNLAAEGLRMEAPIPGKSAIGVEVPNQHPSNVYLRDLLESDEFTNANSKTFCCIGKDVTGNPVFGDIAKMPHVLIAGATGMGKSVCINSILISILYKAKPDEVKFIMVDPKTVEFTMYNGIPHLLVPVVTDVKQAAGALMWAIDEMNRRYELMAKHEVRQLDSYNELVRQNPEIGEKLPKIIIVIDELNDLMQQVRKPVEGLITNITQKARAAGIHMIIGTQRPSVDVITGVIKANVPSRISCKVTSFNDSKTILDKSGAEKLLDKGDMLFAPVGKSDPLRVQGAFVSDGEVEKVMKFLKSNVKGNIYDEQALEDMTRAAQKCSKGKDSDDDFDDEDSEEGAGYLNDKQFLEAVELAVKQGKISTSLIQRKISIGYGKAAKFIDIMEDMGLVSEPNGQKPRDVLVTRDEWHEMLSRRSLDD